MIRMRGLIKKEFLQILRDPSSIAIAFLMPVVLLFLFGYGVSLDAEHIPVAIAVEDPSPSTTNFISQFYGSRYFDPITVQDISQAEQLLKTHSVNAIIHLRGDFARQLRNPSRAQIQVIINGVDANNGRIISGYVQGIWNKWLEHRTLANGEHIYTPIKLEHRVWFNSELRSKNFLVPGLIALIMTLIGALLTALVMAREWERGTMEAIMVTPVNKRELLLGKIIPYFILGMGGMVLTVAIAIWLFDVPIRGSLLLLFISSSLFMLAAIGMGLLISSATRNQFVAGQVAIIVTFLPAFILSGFIFDLGSMPWIIQMLTHVIAARYFVAILQTLFLAGNVWSVVLPNCIALILMGLFFLGLTWKRSVKRLE